MENLKEIKNLIRVAWKEYPTSHTYDMEGFIKKSAYKRGENKTERIQLDGETPYAGYEIYHELDEDGRVGGLSVSSTKIRYIECFKDDRMDTGWGRNDNNGISSCSSPDGYMIDEDGEKIFLINW